MVAFVQDENWGAKEQKAFPQIRELVHKGSPDPFGCHPAATQNPYTAPVWLQHEASTNDSFIHDALKEPQLL